MGKEARMPSWMQSGSARPRSAHSICCRESSKKPRRGSIGLSPEREEEKRQKKMMIDARQCEEPQERWADLSFSGGRGTDRTLAFPSPFLCSRKQTFMTLCLVWLRMEE